MAKFIAKPFTADTVTNRQYRCAVILEEVLQEKNDNTHTRYALKILQNFNRVFSSLKLLQKNQQYLTTLAINEFEGRIMNDTHIDEFVRTLIINVIKTKFKNEILNIKK